MADAIETLVALTQAYKSLTDGKQGLGDYDACPTAIKAAIERTAAAVYPSHVVTGSCEGY